MDTASYKIDRTFTECFCVCVSGERGVGLFVFLFSCLSERIQIWYSLWHKGRNVWAITGDCKLAAPINFYQGHLDRETELLSTRFRFRKWRTRIRNQWLPLVLNYWHVPVKETHSFDSANVFSLKVLKNWGHYFYVSWWRRDGWRPSHQLSYAMLSLGLWAPVSFCFKQKKYFTWFTRICFS